MGGGTLMKIAEFRKNIHPNLFSWEEFADIINNRPLISKSRLNVLQSSKRYEWKVPHWSSDSTSVSSTIIREIVENEIIYLSDMSRCTKKLNALAADIENIFKTPVDAHIYSCRNTEIPHPFGAHFDDSHNIIVQCEGITNFKIWEADTNLKRNNNLDPEALRNIVLDVDMEPGDQLRIPVGYPHLATSKTKRLSVSFPIKVTPGIMEDRTWVNFD